MNVAAETLPVTVPSHDEQLLVARSAPESLAAEQYRVLLRRIDRASAARPLRTVAVSSCGRGEGRSVVAANLALTAARDGREVLLVEGDLLRPSLERLLDLPPGPGLAELAEGKIDLGQAITRVHGLAVLRAGDVRDPAAVARSPRLAAALDTLRSSFALSVLDAPPALALGDAGRLASWADGVVLVVRAAATPREAVRLAVEELSDRLLGLVLNGVDEPGYARYLRGGDAVGA